MKHLLAKVRGRKGEFVKVISNKDIFELPNDLNNQRAYDSDYKLEEDEWFAIPQFSTKDFCIDILINPFNSVDYNQINQDEFLNLNYLCSYQSNVYYFQKLRSSQIISKKYFSLSNTPTLIENKTIIVIDNYPDAIYIKDEDILYFKYLSSITTIFKGIDKLYREATEEETEAFLENDFIQLANNYTVKSVKNANRKRIAMAIDTLQKYTPQEKKDIFVYIDEYCDDLDFDANSGCFKISTEEELKKLLYGIEQRYYTTRLGAERRLANSIITLP